jgi:hypothetical protein
LVTVVAANIHTHNSTSFLGLFVSGGEDKIPNMEKIKESWGDDASMEELLGTLYMFIKCVIGMAKWKKTFEPVRGHDNFWKGISKCDIAFLLFVLDSNLANWQKEFANPATKTKGGKGTHTSKVLKINNYAEWSIKVGTLAEANISAKFHNYLQKVRGAQGAHAEDGSNQEESNPSKKKARLNYPPSERGYFSGLQQEMEMEDQHGPSVGV